MLWRAASSGGYSLLLGSPHVFLVLHPLQSRVFPVIESKVSQIAYNVVCAVCTGAFVG